jgi:hypothetical protein
MVKWPENLSPSASEPVELPDGVSVVVPKTNPTFRRWSGRPLGDTFGNKTVLDFEGRPAFAELAILWSFIATGWDGVWVDSYGKRHLREFWPVPVSREIPPEQHQLLREITSGAAGHGRPWDVFCWSEAGVIFAEAKRKGRDPIRPTQIAFLTSALHLGLPISSFLIVEWSVA